MDHFVMISLWCSFLSTTLDFAFFILEWIIVKRLQCYVKKKKKKKKKKNFQTTQLREAIKLW